MLHAGASPSQRHEAGRIVAFSDGVVAIAITLLILPLSALSLPNSGDAITNPLGYVWQENQTLIVSFLITWAVIVVFWLIHHNVFGRIARVNTEVLAWNIVWLFGVVVFPFPMNLMNQIDGTADAGSMADRQVVVFYVFTMFVISFAMSMISEQLRANRDLLTEEAAKEPPPSRVDTWAATVYLGAVVVIALIKPGFALWSLIGMAFLGYLTKPPKKRKVKRKSDTTAHPPSESPTSSSPENDERPPL